MQDTSDKVLRELFDFSLSFDEMQSIHDNPTEYEFLYIINKIAHQHQPTQLSWKGETIYINVEKGITHLSTALVVNLKRPIPNYDTMSEWAKRRAIPVALANEIWREADYECLRGGPLDRSVTVEELCSSSTHLQDLRIAIVKRFFHKYKNIHHLCWPNIGDFEREITHERTRAEDQEFSWFDIIREV